MAELKTIIVLRNGSKEAWEAEDSYTLVAGEVGVGYMDVMNEDGSAVAKTVPIVKIGDGQTAWKDLPQAEGVFEKDVTLTATFGKYTPSSAGFIKVPNSKGMTTTEFLMDALSEVKEPTITAPSFTLSATSLGTKEIGTTITSVSWTGTYTNGSYSNGAIKGSTKYDAPASSNQTVSGYEVTCTPVDGLGIVVSNTEQKEDGTATFSTGYTVSGTASKKIASVSSKCSWGASDRQPLNNVGEPTDGQLAAGSSTKSVDFSVSGYREGFYFGGTTTKTAPADINSAMLRNIPTKFKRYISSKWQDKNKTATNYAAGEYKIKVPVGTATIIFACPEASTGVTKVYNNTVNADMTSSFTKTSDVSVGGADATSTDVGNYAVDYNVWTFTPNDAYGTETELTVTLG